MVERKKIQIFLHDLMFYVDRTINKNIKSNVSPLRSQYINRVMTDMFTDGQTYMRNEVEYGI